jgi:hypothetical protein
MTRSRRHAHVGEEAYPYAATITIHSTWARDARTGLLLPTDTSVQRAGAAAAVVLREVGLGRGDAGHSWISLELFEGRTETHGTWGDRNQRRGYEAGYSKDRELRAGAVSDFSRSADITPEQLERFRVFCREMNSLGAKAHTKISPCSWFASTAWEVTTGERLQHRHLGISNPTTVCRSIARFNGYELQQTQEPGHRL